MNFLLIRYHTDICISMKNYCKYDFRDLKSIIAIERGSVPLNFSRGFRRFDVLRLALLFSWWYNADMAASTELE